MLRKLVFALALTAVALQPPAKASEGLDATCIASCGSYPSVSCNTSGSCTSMDRNCAVGQQGYVNCGSTTIYCAAGCPPPEEFDCSEYNTAACTYTFNPSTGCCTGQHVNPKLSCLMVC